MGQNAQDLIDFSVLMGWGNPPSSRMPLRWIASTQLSKKADQLSRDDEFL